MHTYIEVKCRNRNHLVVLQLAALTWTVWPCFWTLINFKFSILKAVQLLLESYISKTDNSLEFHLTSSLRLVGVKFLLAFE